MNPNNRKVGIISLILMLPALFLCASGVLDIVFGVKAANDLLDSAMAHSIINLLLSPVVVLGGLLAAFVLNAGKIIHLSAELVNEELVVALSVKRLFGHLLCMTVAGGLMLLLTAYAFVENFRIVAR